MIVTKKFTIHTRGNGDTIDVTSRVAQEIKESGVKDGTVTIFVPGSTAAIGTIEMEQGLLAEQQAMWERLVPKDITYRHNLIDDNGHSHLRATLMGPSLVVPIVQGNMTLGTWQQVFLADFDDRPRSREIILQLMGD